MSNKVNEEHLRKWASSLPSSEGGKRSDGRFWVADGLPTLDINREMLPPGTNARYPEGVVGIRTDDDFFSAAALSWRYRDLPASVIAPILWPYVLDRAEENMAPFEFNPDSGYLYVDIEIA
jgi:hypothetical protein